MTSTASTATATRATKGSKTVVRITFPDGSSTELGGKRAERAAVAIVSRTETGWGTLGLRADAQAAERETARMTFCLDIAVVPVTGAKATRATARTAAQARRDAAGAAALDAYRRMFPGLA